MNIKKLSILQIVIIYFKSLYNEFPGDERRPLVMIIKGLIKKSYECLGIFRAKELLGYAFFVKNGNDYLWDYFVVLEPYRNKGVGSAIIKMVIRYYMDAHSVIGEIEDPDFAVNNNERCIRERRRDFYFRNGCYDTKVRAKTFGVRYILIQLAGHTITPKEVNRLYKMFYRNSLPKYLFTANIKTKLYTKCND